MKLNTKSSITLPPDELALVESLRTALGAKTKVEVIRRALNLLKERLDRRRLKKAYLDASRLTQAEASESTESYELVEEGLGEW